MFMKECDILKLGINYKFKEDVWIDYLDEIENINGYVLSVVYGTMYILPELCDIKKSLLKKYSNVIIGKFKYMGKLYNQITILDCDDYYDENINKEDVSKTLTPINLYY